MSLLDQIRDLADELTEPRAHHEPYTVWVGGHRKTRHHPTVQHGLLRQLYTAAIVPTLTGDDEASGSIPASRPPLEVEALSRHGQITAAAAAWCKTLGLKPRGTAESNIRALVGALAQADDDQQRHLHADLRRWTGWCRVYLGLEQVRRIAGTRCPLPEFAKPSTLRINLTTSHGLCTSCGATWNHETIGVLAEHIRASRGAAA
jgi:hypothetical protein